MICACKVIHGSPCLVMVIRVSGDQIVLTVVFTGNEFSDAIIAICDNSDTKKVYEKDKKSSENRTCLDRFNILLHSSHCPEPNYQN